MATVEMDLLIVTDLDDTIYDWLGFYVPSFRAMLSEVERISGVSKDSLIPAFRRVHQRHGTTEYAFSIEELDVLPTVETPEDARVRLEQFAPAIQAFRDTRRELLRPYPGVRETLGTLKSRGVPVVAHSDSMIEYVSRRLRQLDLDGLFAAIYAPEDHGVPPAIPESLVRKKPLEDVRARTDHRLLPSGSRKPDPAILKRIANDFGCPIDRTVYVGDSLSRDVQMAQRSSAIGVWARYGAHGAGEDLEFLKSISYWREEEMEAAEGSVAGKDQPKPRFAIDGFAQILEVVTVLKAHGS